MLLSVCVITYNHEDYIEQAITSVLNQDVTFDYEIVVGEDCSTDLTADVLRRLEVANPGRLKVIYRENNIGATENVLRTIESCSGAYIAFLEGDDFWTSMEKLELQVAFLDRHQEASFCFHRTRFLFTDQQSLEYVLPQRDPPMLSSFDFLLQEGNQVAVHSIVARRAYLTDLRVWIADLKLGDWPLCLMLATQGLVGFVPMEMSIYRVHVGGTWSQLSPHRQLVYVIQMFFHISELLSGDQKSLVERRKAEWADLWSNYLIHDPKVQLDAVENDLNHLGSCELSTYLLSRAADKARNLEQSRLLHEQQARAWEATAAHANRLSAQLSAEVAELKTEVAELKKQTARMEVVVGARIRKWLAGFRLR